MYLKCQYTDNDLDVDLYPHLLTPELAKKWYDYIDSIFLKESRRTSLLFGDPGLVYSVTYQGVTSNTLALEWNNLPALYELKSLIENITGQKYTVCAIQHYPTGNVGIGPHRDKEMVSGTRICGVSLGATRTIQFTRANHQPKSIPLLSGSLYCMNPPTNQKWLHSIIKESRIKQSRYSLTFRDYRG